MQGSQFESPAPLTEVEISEIEALLARPLPGDYRQFALEYAGAFVGGAVDGNCDLGVDYFLGAKDHQIFNSLKNEDNFLREGILPIAGCVLGNRFVLATDNTIVYINYYGRRTTVHKVASCFQEFIDRIVILSDD